MDRQKVMRIVLSAWAIIGGAVFVIFLRDWRIDTVPAPWIGYILIGIGIFGLLGVNVFRGGPLDKRIRR